MATSRSNAATLSMVNQVMTIMIQSRPFDATLASSSALIPADVITEILRAVPRFFFHSARSVGIQSTRRHRSPLKQRNLWEESRRRRADVLVLGPAAHRDPERVSQGVAKAEEFFFWVENDLGFHHTEATCRQMACVFARACCLKDLWRFLKEIARASRFGPSLIDIITITCLIKVLGEEGLVQQAFSLFKQMRRYNCKPNVQAYNIMIYALCQVGDFKTARLLFNQMQLPGFRCPADCYTYTILISSFCKHALRTGCKKAVRRRVWEANHLFRLMLFNGFSPDVVTYNGLIDGCLRTYRIDRAIELFQDMAERGCIPNRITYNSFIRYYSRVNEIQRAIEMLQTMQRKGHGVASNSSYTPVIHALCECNRPLDAYNMLLELLDSGSVPREYTYNLVRTSLASAGHQNMLDDAVHKRVQDGIEKRCRDTRRSKPVTSWKNAT